MTPPCTNVKHAFPSIVSLTLTLLYGHAGDVTNPSTFEHVAEKFFHGSVADRATEEQTLDSVRRNVAQSWHGQQEASEPATATERPGSFQTASQSAVGHPVTWVHPGFGWGIVAGTDTLQMQKLRPPA